MKAAFVIVTTIIYIFISLYEWPKMDRKQKKDRFGLVMLSIVGWMLAFVLIIFPDIPGPIQFIEYVFKPIGRLLDH